MPPPPFSSLWLDSLTHWLSPRSPLFPKGQKSRQTSLNPLILNLVLQGTTVKSTSKPTAEKNTFFNASYSYTANYIYPASQAKNLQILLTQRMMLFKIHLLKQNELCRACKIPRRFQFSLNHYELLSNNGPSISIIACRWCLIVTLSSYMHSRTASSWWERWLGKLKDLGIRRS